MVKNKLLMVRHYCLFFLAILHVMIGFAQDQFVPLKFEKTTHDFGDIKESNGNVTYTFQFTNNGTDDIHIQDVVVSCGCTTPEWTRDAVKPGEKGFIEAVFDPANRPGTFNKSLTVLYNETNNYIDLNITGNVEPIMRTIEEEYSIVMGGIRVKSRIISFLKITTEKTVKQTISVYNEMNKSASWDSEYEAPDHLRVKFIPEEIPAKSYGNIEVTYDPREIKLLGYKGDKLEVSTDEWFNSTKRFTVIAFLEEYFPSMTSEQLMQAPKLEINHKIHDFGSIKEGDTVKHDFIIKNNGKKELNIRMTRASCGCTVSKPEKSNLLPGESSVIKVTFNSKGKNGEQSETILVFSNDPTNPTQKIKIVALVEKGISN